MFSPVVLLATCLLIIELWHDPKPLIVYQYQTLAHGTALVLMNSMTCRVFRIIRLLKAEEASTSQIDDVVNISTLQFRDTAGETLE